MLGNLLQSLIQLWISLTGKKVALTAYPWLVGPISHQRKVGSNFHQSFAEAEGLSIKQHADAGLLQDFSVTIDPKDPHAALLHPAIAHFYEHTAAYKLDVWSQWFSIYRFFAKILIRTVSRRMEQMNIPLEPLETSHGMSSDVIQLWEGETVKYTCWLRKSVKTGHIVYAGFYTHCKLAADQTDLVKVVFPLPKGNVTVLLRAVVQADGSVKLISDGKRFGESGYYRIQDAGTGYIRVKFIPLKEMIHVYEDEFGVMRTDHIFRFLGKKMLELHYKISPTPNLHRTP